VREEGPEEKKKKTEESKRTKQPLALIPIDEPFRDKDSSMLPHNSSNKQTDEQSMEERQKREKE